MRPAMRPDGADPGSPGCPGQSLFDTGQFAARKEEGTGGADEGKNGSGIFRGVDASAIRMERNADEEEKGCTDEQKGGFLHGGFLKLEGTVCLE